MIVTFNPNSANAGEIVIFRIFSKACARAYFDLQGKCMPCAQVLANIPSAFVTTLVDPTPCTLAFWKANKLIDKVQGLFCDLWLI